jgi:excisionase family DNA binding protein
MIETEGMITVAEAAKRLDRSIEQVRRYLREGKLKGQRIGNQWFVDEASLETGGKELAPLIPKELMTKSMRPARLYSGELGSSLTRLRWCGRAARTIRIALLSRCKCARGIARSGSPFRWSQNLLESAYPRG